jgi:hypothetical protein
MSGCLPWWSPARAAAGCWWPAAAGHSTPGISSPTPSRARLVWVCWPLRHTSNAVPSPLHVCRQHPAPQLVVRDAWPDVCVHVLTLQEDAVASDGLAMLRGPVGHRGVVAAATAGGRLLLLDPRTKWQVGWCMLCSIAPLSCARVPNTQTYTHRACHAGLCRHTGPHWRLRCH